MLYSHFFHRTHIWEYLLLGIRQDAFYMSQKLPWWWSVMNWKMSAECLHLWPVSCKPLAVHWFAFTSLHFQGTSETLTSRPEQEEELSTVITARLSLFVTTRNPCAHSCPSSVSSSTRIRAGPLPLSQAPFWTLSMFTHSSSVIGTVG